MEKVRRCEHNRRKRKKASFNKSSFTSKLPQDEYVENTSRASESAVSLFTVRLVAKPLPRIPVETPSAPTAVGAEQLQGFWIGVGIFLGRRTCERGTCERGTVGSDRRA